jgi:mRNA-degrading endonuclease RelE of RelBE toxin-antitoxin system
MKVQISVKAEEQLDSMSEELRLIFMKHMRKIQSTTLRRHMKYGMPFYVEEVTKQARIIYYLQDEEAYITHCFKSHKEYERWYKSYR